jgi:hypothetical protein
MRKIIMFGARILVFLFLVGFLQSCKKDIEKKPFNLSTKTFYRVAPIAPEPIIVNGLSYVSTGFFPGGGKGTASYLGEITIYFNQQIFSESAETPPLGSIGAPITDIPFYPLLGGPLPLIQPGDFTELASIISLFHVPEAVHGKFVNEIVYNKKGDAIFTAAIDGTGRTFPISATIVGFDGKALIVGGRGKFSNAIGEIDYEGRFSVVNPNDAVFTSTGWIHY